MIENKPFFSVILPTHNRSTLLKRAIKSVIEQEFEDWELIIVDDGSTDDTGNIVETFHDSRINYIYQENGMVAKARNNGIIKSRGEYICFLDDDDEYLEIHLKILNSKIKENSNPIALFFTLCYRETKGLLEKIDDCKSTPESPILLGYNPETPNICIHKNILDVHSFNEKLLMRSDAELWGRIAKKFPVVRINEYTTIIHMHDDLKLSQHNHKTYLELERTYDYIFSTRDQRVHIPKEAEKRIRVDIYLKLFSYYKNLPSGKCIKYLIKLLRINFKSILIFQFRRILSNAKHKFSV